MPKLACKIPKKVALACSGGADSMAALSFLLRGRREVELLHYNHGTAAADEAENFLHEVANSKGLKLNVGRSKNKLKESEAAWREARYSFFSQSTLPIVMGHHLNDAVEWWIFSSLRGNPKLMPVSRKHGKVDILRPFMFFTKNELVQHNYLSNITDPSNINTDFSRNRIRSEIVPQALIVNPGLMKTIKNLYGKKNG